MSADTAPAATADWPLIPPEKLVSRLVKLLDVEALEGDLFRGMRLPGGQGRVFGGQVIAQALMAASRTVDADRSAHSLHAYFMRPGDEELPIEYQVQRDYQGRSFTTRRVVATQAGQPILNLSASFQTFEEGLAHQSTMPDVPPPEDLLSDADHVRAAGSGVPERIARFLTRPRAIETRPVTRRSPFEPVKREPLQYSWFRAVAPASDDPVMQRAILAYASDMALLSTCTLPHGVNWLTQKLQSASLDHSLWIHEPFRIDDWLLYATDSPWAGHGRGFNRGQIFSRDGRLVASTAQEGLIRLRE